MFPSQVMFVLCGVSVIPSSLLVFNMETRLKYEPRRLFLKERKRPQLESHQGSELPAMRTVKMKD